MGIKLRKILLNFVLALLLIASTENATSKENYNSKNQWPKNRIGLSASTFTGFGLTYYRHFGEDFVGKINLYAFGESRRDGSYSKDFFSTIGTELQYNMHKTKYTRLHIFTALSLWYDEREYSYERENRQKITSITIRRTYVTGFGFGFEFLAWGIISFNIETGLMGRFGVKTYKNNDLDPKNKTTYPQSYGFGIGGGISYAF